MAMTLAFVHRQGQTLTWLIFAWIEISAVFKAI